MTRALYYPYIHFKDTAWLKSAVLYWDQIGRIVPQEYDLHDSPDVALLRDHEDEIVTQFAPGPAQEEVGPAFLQLVDDWETELLGAYAIEMRDHWPLDNHSVYAAPNGADMRLAYLNRQKMSAGLQERLLTSGLAEEGEGGQRPDWLGMHPRLVRVYMTALAQAMGSEKLAHPCTDEPIDFSAAGGVEVERLAQALLVDVRIAAPLRAGREVEEAMVTMAIESVVPAGLNDVPMDEVIDIRADHLAQRVAFQDGIRQLIDSMPDLAGAESAEAIDWHLRNEFDNRVRVPLEELRTSLRDNRIDTVSAVVSTEFALPAGLAGVLLAAGAVVAAPISLAVGAAFALWSGVRSQRAKERELLGGSWPAYLLQIEEAAAAPHAVSRMLESARIVQPRLE